MEYGTLEESFAQEAGGAYPIEPERGLATGVARGLTTALEFGRDGVVGLAGIVGRRLSRVGGGLLDAGDDFAAYFDPALWLRDVYSALGIASEARLDQLDDRIDQMDLKIDEVSRQRARDELLLLQQRIGELESLMTTGRSKLDGDTHEAVGALLGRLSELETRIDALPSSDAML